MTTQLLTVGHDWVMVTDGTKTNSVQVLAGVILVVDSDTVPDPTINTGHVVSGWLTITPPTKAWARVTAGNEATLAIS